MPTARGIPYNINGIFLLLPAQHGLHVSTDSPGDDAFIEVEPKHSFQYTYDIPSDHMVKQQQSDIVNSTFLSLARTLLALPSSPFHHHSPPTSSTLLSPTRVGRFGTTHTTMALRQFKRAGGLPGC